MAKWLEKQYQRTPLGAVVEDSMTSGSKVNAPSINAVQNAFSNPNLLINGDFQVAQRGTEFASQNKWFYTVDRWKATNCRVIRAQNTDDDSHYVSVVNTTTQNRYFMQAFEGRLKEDVYTISLEATIYSGTVKVKFEGDTNDGEFLTLQNGINVLTRTVAPTGVTFELGSEADFTLQWVKMEKGSIATPFIPRPYMEELTMCEKYFIVLGDMPLVATYQYTTSNYLYKGTLPVKMRANPTVTVWGVATYLTSSSAAEASSVTLHSVSQNTIAVSATYGDTVRTGTSGAWCYLSADAEIY